MKTQFSWGDRQMANKYLKIALSIVNQDESLN